MVKVKHVALTYSKGLTHCKARTRSEIGFVLAFLKQLVLLRHLLLDQDVIDRFHLFQQCLLAHDIADEVETRALQH